MYAKLHKKIFTRFWERGIDIFSPTKGRMGTIVPSPDVYENSAWKQNDFWLIVLHFYWNKLRSHWEVLPVRNVAVLHFSW